MDGQNGSTNGTLSPSPVEFALAYLRAGFSVIPIGPDGSKAPCLPWKKYQENRVHEKLARLWWIDSRGIAIIGGKVSGGADCVDFDLGELFPLWWDIVESLCPGLVHKLCIIQTPRRPNGCHVRFRCTEIPIPGNMDLASRTVIDTATGKPKTEVMIQTRGEGGYALVPGGAVEAHPSGDPYVHIAGPPITEMAVITAAERQILIDVARSFDQVTAKPRGAAAGAGYPTGDDVRPGDDYDLRGPVWAGILEPHGWTINNGDGIGRTEWCRPGKDKPGPSATTGYCKGADGAELLFVFSSNASPFTAGQPYGKFRAHALLNHGGDFAAAASELAKQGFGKVEATAKPAPRRASNTHRATKAAAATAPAGPAAGAYDPTLAESDTDPHRLARLFLAGYRLGDGSAAAGSMTLRFWQDEFHRWDGQSYRPVDGKELRTALVKRIKVEFDAICQEKIEEWQGKGRKGAKPVPQAVSGKLLGNVVMCLESLCVLAYKTTQPEWVNPWVNEPVAGDAVPFAAGQVLACRNALLHLPSLEAGDGFEHALTPAFFSPNALDYDFVADAGEPSTWLEFLEKLWPDDVQSLATLQEWFGYCLLPDTSQQKILMMVGPKRGGKGTIVRVLNALVGPANVANPTLTSLSTPFGLQCFIGKTLAIINDARISHRTDAAVVTERLLSISGEDSQTIDRKHMTSVHCTLPTRFVVISNELPRLNDASGALVGRLVLLRLTKSWYGQEDIHLTAKLLGELPGILRWAITGWQRLHERGYFEQPDTSGRLLQDMEDLSSPIGAFVRDCCEVGPGFEVFVRDIFEAWRDWCKEKGRREAGNEQTFGRDMRAALPAIDVRQSRIDGSRVRLYEGVRLRSGLSFGNSTQTDTEPDFTKEFK